MAHYTLLKYKFKYIFKSGPQEQAKWSPERREKGAAFEFQKQSGKMTGRCKHPYKKSPA
jgi:hypothetical protein